MGAMYYAACACIVSFNVLQDGEPMYVEKGPFLRLIETWLSRGGLTGTCGAKIIR